MTDGICVTCKAKPWINYYYKECSDCFNVYATISSGTKEEKANLIVYLFNKVEQLEGKLLLKEAIL